MAAGDIVGNNNFEVIPVTMATGETPVRGNIIVPTADGWVVCSGSEITNIAVYFEKREFDANNSVETAVIRGKVEVVGSGSAKVGYKIKPGADGTALTAADDVLGNQGFITEVVSATRWVVML